MADSDSSGLAGSGRRVGGLRFCISNSFPGDTDDAGPKTTLSNKGGAKRDMLLNEKMEKRKEGIQAISERGKVSPKEM